MHRWLTDPQYRESQSSLGWALEYCKYLDCLQTVIVGYVASWHERDRYQCMLVSRYKDGKNPEMMSRRDDFKLAARSLAVVRHQEWRENPHIPRNNENDSDHSTNSHLVGTPTLARTTSMARTTRLAPVAGMERMVTGFLSHQVTLQISLPNCFFF